MKNIILILSFCISQFAFCDIIPDNSHSVNKCVKITNADDFSDISFLGHVTFFDAHEYSYEIKNTKCLSKGYKMNRLKIYALPKQEVEEKDLEDFDLSKENNAVVADKEIDPYGGYIHDSIPIDSIDVFYRIMGFTEKHMVLHKYKKVIKYNNDLPDSVQTFNYEGDSTILYKNIQVGFNNVGSKTAISVFPNPVKESLNIEFDDNFSGNVNVRIYTLAGKELLKSTKQRKYENEIISLSVNDLEKGIYLLEVQFGELLKTQKIVLE